MSVCPWAEKLLAAETWWCRDGMLGPLGVTSSPACECARAIVKMFSRKSFLAIAARTPNEPVARIPSPLTRSTMPQSCKDLRAALAFCLQNSDCIMVSSTAPCTPLSHSHHHQVERHTPGDCLRPPLKYTLPTQCQQLQRGYAECKKGLIDMRKRFRGNRPISVAGPVETGQFGEKGPAEDDKVGTIEERGYMLYAGRPHKSVPESKGDGDPGADKGERK